VAFGDARHVLINHIKTTGRSITNTTACMPDLLMGTPQLREQVAGWHKLLGRRGNPTRQMPRNGEDSRFNSTRQLTRKYKFKIPLSP
jgi:hypothetical protein